RLLKSHGIYGAALIAPEERPTKRREKPQASRCGQQCKKPLVNRYNPHLAAPFSASLRRHATCTRIEATAHLLGRLILRTGLGRRGRTSPLSPIPPPPGS